MALINTNKRWMYLLEPHTASRATSKALLRFGFVEVGGWHSKVGPLQEAGMIPDVSDYEIGVTLRNPIDVLITRWLKDRQKDQRLFDWITSIEPIYYTRALAGVWKGATTFCWYEHLLEDLRFVFSAPDLELEYDPEHKTQESAQRLKKPWWVYLEEEPKVKGILLRHYSDFMETFGYHLSSWQGRPHMFINEDIRQSKRRKIRWPK